MGSLGGSWKLLISVEQSSNLGRKSVSFSWRLAAAEGHTETAMMNHTALHGHGVKSDSQTEKSQGKYFQSDITSSLKACSTTESDCTTPENRGLSDKLSFS